LIKTYAMRRPSKIGTATRDRDELTPEAHLWRLTEGMVRSGRLKQVEVSEADFAAAIDKYCPDLSKLIYAKLGLEPFELPTTGRRGRVTGKRTVATAPPTPVDDLPDAG
jgi:hypothetical protein